ncbi:MAG: diaminopimelate decarboxylase [Sphaerochaetaceae bacterium]|nr:diaminopimelate decarboxylase [Sphaerochaetaceae bacterium]
MSLKNLPLEDKELQDLIKDVPTPFYLYDEKAILNNAQNFIDLFKWAPSFINYFAVKACPNPSIMKRLFDLGFGADCSSLPELELSHKCGLPGAKMMMTSNDTPDEEFVRAYELGAIINLDDITHIEAMENALGCVPDTICFRYNPGPDRTGNVIIGNPVEAKYGVTKDQIIDCYRIMKEKGVKHFGLQTMVASNELDGDFIIETAHMLFSLTNKIYQETGVKLEFVDFGGGVGIPYQPEQNEMDVEYVSEQIKELYDNLIVRNHLDPIQISFELGRYILGPYGYLISKVRHVTHKYKDYVGLDSCMADLMRPALYGSYHHISVLGKKNDPKNKMYDVTGSLCENNDKFAIDRMLPEVERGDILVLHDAGAHGHAMGFNYNAKLRPAEYLLTKDGTLNIIRRAQTMDDYFETLRFDGAEVEV